MLEAPRTRFLKPTRGHETREPEDRHASRDANAHPHDAIFADRTPRCPALPGTVPHVGKEWGQLRLRHLAGTQEVWRLGWDTGLGMTLHMREIGVVRDL